MLGTASSLASPSRRGVENWPASSTTPRVSALTYPAAGYTKAAIGGSIGGSSAGLALTAQAEVKAGFELQAQLPLDIFAADGAGLIVRLSLGASGSASLALVGTLSLGELIDRLLPDFEGAWETFLSLVLDELDISVGIWGHVEVAVEVQAHAITALNILPSDDPGRQPGFTLQFGYRSGCAGPLEEHTSSSRSAPGS